VTPAPLTLDDVLAARERIGGRLRRTPLLESTELSRETGASVLLKAELFQHTGSFKPRGVLSKLATLTSEERARGLIGISAGNHAMAVAYGAALEGLDALLVMWSTASATKIERTRAYGAGVDLEAPDPTAAFARVAELQAETGRVLVHPHEDPFVAAGAGTVGLEVAEDAPEVSLVLVAVGGGGLVTGVATAVKGLRPDARVVAVEPERSAALHAALAAGEPVPVVPTSVADGCNAPFAGALPLATCRALGVESVLVTEDEIAAAFRFLYGSAKLAAEPAGAVATAALLAGKVVPRPGETAVAIVSGGNVVPETAAAILAGR
jgi:threonine dehydratase